MDGKLAAAAACTSDINDHKAWCIAKGSARRPHPAVPLAAEVPRHGIPGAGR